MYFALWESQDAAPSAPSTEALPGPAVDAPIDTLALAISKWFHQHMPLSVQTMWFSAAKRTQTSLVVGSSDSRGVPLTTGNICAGSDIVSKALNKVFLHFKQTPNFDVVPEVVFQCENDPGKREHLRTRCPIEVSIR